MENESSESGIKFLGAKPADIHERVERAREAKNNRDKRAVKRVQRILSKAEIREMQTLGIRIRNAQKKPKARRYWDSEKGWVIENG